MMRVVCVIARTKEDPESELVTIWNRFPSSISSKDCHNWGMRLIQAEVVVVVVVVVAFEMKRWPSALVGKAPTLRPIQYLEFLN